MPITNSKFPKIEPVIEANTSSSKPALIAMMVMISSAALPKVALSNPPTRGFVRAAKASVPSPIYSAIGITLSADNPKTNNSPQWLSSASSANGKASMRRVSGFFFR